MRRREERARLARRWYSDGPGEFRSKAKRPEAGLVGVAKERLVEGGGERERILIPTTAWACTGKKLPMISWKFQTFLERLAWGHLASTELNVLTVQLGIRQPQSFPLLTVCLSNFFRIL